MPDLHPSAAQGFKAAAAAYGRGRPDYPEALLDWLTGKLGLGPGRTCVDLGAGTGKSSRFAARTGAEVLAVEPVAEMRAQLEAALPGIRALDGTAQAMPLPTASADAVLCATAFHWFASRETLAEIHRVLKPGGTLGLVWNVRDESVPWVAALSALMEPFEAGTPRQKHGAWRLPFEGGPFTGLEQTTIPHGHEGPPEEVIIDRVLTVSFIARLPETERKDMERALRELIEADPALRGRETVRFPYTTQAYHCRRR